MKRRSAIKTDLFAADRHREKIDTLGDPLQRIERHIDFLALAQCVDEVASRPVSLQGGRPPFPTDTMVRILVLKRLYNLSDEQMEFQLLDRMSYQRFCGLTHAANIPDRTKIRDFENRIGAAGASALFDGMTAQLLQAGFLARGGQIIDATLVPAPKQHLRKEEKALLEQDATPANWSPAKRRQKDRDVYADRGSTSKAREAWLKANGYRSQIQRKGVKNKPLSASQQKRNHRIAKSRARVEHVFGTMAQMGGKLIRTIGQARADFALTMQALAYNLKRFAWLKEAGIEAF